MVELKGFTQEAVAKEMGYSRNSFIRYYNQEELREPFIEKAMKVLNVPRTLSP